VKVFDDAGCAAHGFASRGGHGARMRAGATVVCSLVNKCTDFSPAVSGVGH
jgi:hypothetical protein